MSEAPLQGTIDELRADVASREDSAILAEWQRELNTERGEALRDIGKVPTEFVLRDGVAMPAEQHQAEVAEQGTVESGPYDNGRRA